MSDIAGKKLLDDSVQKVVAFFNNEVSPRLNKKNKVISVSVAVALTLVYIIRDRVFKPPRNIRHIPYFGYFSVIKSLYKGDSLFDRGYKVIIPMLNKSNLGLYAEPGRFGWEIHVSNPEDAKKILLKQESFPKLNITEGNENTLISKFVGGPNVVLTMGQEWKNQRMVINPAFRRSLPVKLFGKITQEVFTAMERMDNTTVNVSDLIMRLTLEGIGRAGFDFNFHSLDKMENNEWVDIYNDIAEGLQDRKFFLFPFLDSTFLWLFPERKRLHEKLDKFLKMLDGVIERRKDLLKEGNSHNSHLQENEKDLLTLLIESENRGEGLLTHEELKSNLCMFFFAGHDTTASALTSVMYHLGKHPEIQQKAREEAIRILGDEPIDVIPTVEDTKKMVYINQILKETLRLNNPFPRVVARKAAEDVVLSGGTFIPKDSIVTVNVFDIHHKESNWKDGSKFDPDRFADSQEGTRGPGEGLSWIPFGNGARQCIGMNFSLNEQRVFLSMMLRKYSWTIPEDSIHKDGLVTSGIPVVSPVTLNLTFKKRY